MSLDMTEIKEAAARYAANHVGPSFMSRGEVETEARKLALAVPDLITENARLQTLAREGWTEARSIWEGNDTTIDGRLDAALTEIGEAPARAETIGLRIDPEVQETIRKATAEIERLTAENVGLRLKIAALEKEATPEGFTCLLCTRTGLTRDGFEHAEGCLYGIMKEPS